MSSNDPQRTLDFGSDYERELNASLLARRTGEHHGVPVLLAQLLASPTPVRLVPAHGAPENTPEVLAAFYDQAGRVRTLGDAVQAWTQHRYALGTVEPEPRAVAWKHLLAIVRRLPRNGSDLVEVFRATLKAEVGRRRAAYERTANAMGLPGDPNVREPAYDDWLPESESLRLFREAWAWRTPRRAACIRVVSGAKGIGKTVAAAHVLLRTCGESAVYLAATWVGPRDRRTGFQAQQEWERWCQARAMLLDDLGTEEDPTRITELLLERYNAGRVTFVTCNLTRDDVHKHYYRSALGDRLFDRLRHAQAEDGGLASYVLAQGPCLRNAKERAAWITTKR